MRFFILLLLATYAMAADQASVRAKLVAAFLEAADYAATVPKPEGKRPTTTIRDIRAMDSISAQQAALAARKAWDTYDAAQAAVKAARDWVSDMPKPKTRDEFFAQVRLMDQELNNLIRIPQ